MIRKHCFQRRDPLQTGASLLSIMTMAADASRSRSSAKSIWLKLPTGEALAHYCIHSPDSCTGISDARRTGLNTDFLQGSMGPFSLTDRPSLYCCKDHRWLPPSPPKYAVWSKGDGPKCRRRSQPPHLCQIRCKKPWISGVPPGEHAGGKCGVYMNETHSKVGCITIATRHRQYVNLAAADARLGAVSEAACQCVLLFWSS